MSTIPNYPPPSRALDGTEEFPLWQNGQCTLTLRQLWLASAAWAATPQTNAKIFADTASGIAGTSAGDFFWVISGLNLELYRNVSGAAVDQGVSGAGSAGNVLAGTPYRSVTVQALLDVESPMGALGPGVVRNMNFDKRFTSAINDSTSTGLDMRSMVISTEFDGANGAYQVVGLHLTPNFYHDNFGGTAPNITFGYGIKQACRIGLANAKNGTLTTFRGIETHTAIEGLNVVTDLFNFNCGQFDWLNGTGTATNLIGYHCEDLSSDGGAARISTMAACFYATDQTDGAPLSAGFYSNLAVGTNKYNFYAGASAPSVFSGAVRIGDTVKPTAQLEVHGIAKLSSDGSVLNSGTYHELRIQNSGATAVISNSHASTPGGLNITFSAASPNNRTQTFLVCSDSTTSRFRIYSDGTVMTSAQLLANGSTSGVGYATGAGTTAVQGSTKSTAVNCNRPCGQITMNAAALAAGAKVSFVVNNSTVAATDIIIVNVVSGGTANAYRAAITAVAAGSFTVTVENITAGSLSEAPVIGFAVIKGVIA